MTKLRTIPEATLLPLLVFLSLTAVVFASSSSPATTTTNKHQHDSHLRHHQQHPKSTTTSWGGPAAPAQIPGPPTIESEVQSEQSPSKRAAPSSSSPTRNKNDVSPLAAPSALMLPPSSSEADDEDPELQTLTICALLPFDPSWLFSVQRVREAMQVALMKVTSGPNALLPSRINLTAVYRDSNCSISVGMKEAIEAFVTDQVTVFFGPCCDYSAAPVGRQAKYWNIPMVTSGALSSEFARQKEMYSHLTRIGPNFNSLASFVLTMLSEYHWHRVMLVYDSWAQSNIIERFCHFAINGIYQGLGSRNQNAIPNLKHDHFKVSQSDTQAELRQKLVSKVGTKFANWDA